jgi:hypothetical protein
MRAAQDFPDFGSDGRLRGLASCNRLKEFACLGHRRNTRIHKKCRTPDEHTIRFGGIARARTDQIDVSAAVNKCPRQNGLARTGHGADDIRISDGCRDTRTYPK